MISDKQLDEWVADAAFNSKGQVITELVEEVQRLKAEVARLQDENADMNSLLDEALQ